MLMNAKMAIKRVNIGKVKLDEVLSFEKSPHDKIGLGYDESNKVLLHIRT
jgi:hypothetical protein